jgi:hypothetical protein
MTTPSPRVRRLRSQNPLVDLRVCTPEQVLDLSCLFELHDELAAFGPVRNLRVWVLPDAATGWTRDAGALVDAMAALYGAAVSAPLPEGAGEACALTVGAAACPALVAALASLGMPTWRLRPAGGLPINEVNLDGAEVAMMQGPPLAPLGPAALGGVFAAIHGADEEEAPALWEAAEALLEGLLDQHGRAPAPA